MSTPRSHASSTQVTASRVLGRPTSVRADPQDLVGRIALWLLVVVGVDLLVTRFVVRLAMFIPKEEPLVTLAVIGGRVAAVTDTLVALMGVLLLGAFVVRARRLASMSATLAVLSVGLAAAGGFALLWVAPSPTLVALVGLAVAVGAAVVGTVAWRASSLAPAARVGTSLLALAIGCAGLRSVLAALGVGVSAIEPGGSAAVIVAAVGEVAFVAGAAVVGVAGLASARRLADPRLRWWLVLAAVVSGVVLMAWLRAPASWQELMIWSIGLTEAVPVPVTAVVAGVAVAGLLASRARTPRLARGVAIVLLAGSGLAASGLVLAGLLGLLVATTDGDAVASDAVASDAVSSDAVAGDADGARDRDRDGAGVGDPAGRGDRPLGI